MVGGGEGGDEGEGGSDVEGLSKEATIPSHFKKCCKYWFDGDCVHLLDV